ncbi:Os05g0345250 [Oryza sativa Japonica Group]|uniref:Os05g0345250 protein n=1 Tax=Oryza sativa subsp. japonica TaxID=39947 RepID=A0A0P0WL43_ORYSJ|nr:Os05g0345250 [Oryza sativa Japonica Group]
MTKERGRHHVSLHWMALPQATIAPDPLASLLTQPARVLSHDAIVNFAQAAPYPTLANPHLTRRWRITTAVPNARSGALLLPSSSPMPDWLLPLVVTTITSAHVVVDRWS